MIDAQQENTIYEIQLQADVVALTGLPKQSIAHCRPFSVLALTRAHQASSTLQPTTLRTDVSGMVCPFTASRHIHMKVCTVWIQVQPAGQKWQRLIMQISLQA